MQRFSKVTAILIGVIISGAHVVANCQEAKQLGTAAVTEFGAERAGNKEGTIPDYLGVAPKLPGNFNPKKRTDIYGEKPLFTITAQNAAQYADKLDAMVEIFKRNPNFRMNIYPSHRDLQFPKYVLDNSVKNATACKAVADELKLEGCYGGVPFPIPKTGNQVMWNHLTAYLSFQVKSRNLTYVVPTTGTPVLMNGNDAFQQQPFYDPKRTSPFGSSEEFYRVRVDDYAPTRSVGTKLLLIDSLDQVRRVWQYIPGQRRVKLAPDLAYDTPSPFGGGIALMDDNKAFIGALDRYDFKLIGKKEKFIVYNSLMTADGTTCPAQKLLTKNFPNPDCLRWELHRVWKVEAMLKPGKRHVYKKRYFYWDEDGYASGLAENYDSAGAFWRLVSNIPTPFNEATGLDNSLNFVVDVQTGQWSIAGAACDGCGFTPSNAAVSDVFFSPEDMAGAGIR